METKNVFKKFIEKFKNERKFKIVTLTVIVAILALTTVGVVSYNDYKTKQAEEKAITTYKTNIDKEFAAFSKEEDRAKKLEELKSLIKESNTYKNAKTNKEGKVFSSVADKYDLRIEEMRKYFIEGYDKSIADNTLTDVDNIGDKTQLNTAKDNLNAVLTSIKDEIETVSTKEEVAKYEEKINALTTSYSNRVTAIEEAERKEKEEAEAKARAEEEANRKANSSSSSSSNSSNGSSSRRSSSSNSSSSSSRRNSSSSNRGYVEKYVDGSGNNSYMDGNGRCWDDAGNKWHIEDGDVVLGW